MNRVLRFTGCLLMLAAIAIASDPPQVPVTYHDDFQSYGKSKKPPGWIDGKVGDLKAKPRGYFKTATDPLQDKRGSNLVFGTTKSTGGDDDEKHGNRIGYFSTYVDKTFAAAGRFEVQGRLVEMSSTGRFGLVVLSGYPDKDRYYLIGEKKNGGDDAKATMQLTAWGAGTPTGKVDSTLTINRAKWYRFRISVDDASNTTSIRARFWPDGTTEPTTYQIDASDASSSRLKTGHFGLWSGGRGDSDDDESDDDENKGFYIDDVDAHSPSDVTPPVIAFYESGTKLDPSGTPAFNRDAKIEIRVTDDLSTFTYSALLDGKAYTSLTPVSAEGLHTLTVHAVDAPGNASDATLKFLVDKTPPAITLTANGNPLVDGTIFKADVTVNATVQDNSAVKTTSTLDGTTVTLPLPVAQENNHRLVVNATDAANNPATATAGFTVDKTAPVVTIKANGTILGDGASFNENVTLTWTATDLTLDTVTSTVDNAPVQSGFTVTTEGLHTLVVTAKDKATHSTTETRSFSIAKHAPEVTLLANGSPFEKDSIFNTAVRFTVVVHDPTPTTTVVTVDNNTYTQGNPVTGDGLHSVKVVVTNAGNLSTTVGPFGFTIDTAPPTITMTESGQPFRDGMKFNRDVLPIVSATDALTSSPTIVVTLDGKPYPANTAIIEEKADHVISATATDAAGNIAPVGPFHFMLDKSKPVVTIVNPATGQPFPTDALFNVAVSTKVTVADITKTTVVATLDGTPFNLGSPSTQADGTIVYTPSPISAEGTHTLSVVATDEVGFSNDPATAHFVIDLTPPNITFTDPAPNGTVSSVMITISGTADDAQTITIGGRLAAVNTATKTFTLSDVSLVEGRNEFPAVAVDAAGNRSTPTLVVFLDTRAPDLTITSPAADACIDATAVTVTGNAFDPNIDSVKVTVGDAAPILATIDKATGAWTATVAVTTEGKKQITVEAADVSGHTISSSRSITIDRTPPSIDIRENGTSFTAVSVNRAVTLFVRATDANPALTMTSTLDGTAYVSGTSIGTEGHHKLVVSATDCAGHRSDRTIDFTIDLTPPTIRNLDPANGSTVGTTPSAIRGSTDTDAINVEVSGTQLRATPAADGTFTIASVPFAEGSNHFNLIARDQAGNSSSLDYTVTVKTAAPSVEIRESGLPIASGTLYNRAVTPVIRSADPDATVSAKLNDVSFTSGTTISADGDYRIAATATDRFGHAGTAEATFTIDRTAPVVKITSPASGTVQSDHVQVRGSAAGAVSAAINGQPVSLASDNSFVLDSLTLDVGTNAIVATGRDRAGNTGRDEVSVTRDDLGAGILLTYPPDHSLTNRPATDVIGRLLTPGRTTTVTIGTTSTPVDPTGGFRMNGLALIEGENTITATSTAANGVQTSASTHVTADLTPPTLVILESGQPLTDGARFATQAIISLQAADTAGAVTTDLTIDGSKTTTVPFTITTTGGHSLIATARDLAGNETRSERTLFIGTSTSGTADCKLDSFDPSNGAVILSNSTTLVGRSGGAIGVKVNGVPAVVADGAFVATVELPVEGPNTITIVCTDANGTPAGTPATLTLQRVTGDPSITIDSPQENFVSAQETIAVSGTVGPGVVSVDVNGVAGTITGNDTTTTRPYSVPTVRLAPGLNVLTAHGRNAAARVATASRRGIFAKDAPSVDISSPTASSTTGLPRVTVSGTYTNLDSTTLTVSNLGNPGQAPQAAQFVRASDTGGSFTAVDVPLINGSQTLRVSGRDRLNREAAATVVVTLVSGAPSIAIAQPADHSYFAGGTDSVAVNGTFQAAAGATVDVNGTAATPNGSSYTASAKFSTLAGGTTPIVARVTEPGGASASAIVIVTQLTDAPTVLESFPAPNAVEVDNGALLLVLFSQPMDGTSISTAFRLEDGSGTPVSGTIFLDKDVLTFAPATLLATGAHYTMRVTTAAKNLAGTPLASEYTSSFTIATSAPSSAPTVDPIAAAICGQSITVTGTATPAARVQLDSGTLTLNGSADATGKFTFSYPISGQSGFALVRVRTVGSDGSLSPAAQLTVRVDCSGPSVLNATYDRAVNKLTIQFSEPIDPSTATASSIFLQLDNGSSVSATITVAQSIVTVSPAQDLTAKTFSLNVSTAIKDLVGNPLTAPFTQTFSTTGGDQPPPGHGAGFIAGEVYDATTGRPLAGAAIAIDVATATPITSTTDARGRYLATVPEGAHTIKASDAGYTTVWRQIIVPAGAGVIPIDIRLTHRGDFTTANGSAIAVTNGGDTAITKKIDLAVPAGTLASGKLTLTSAGAQALTGLLPLGWSPLAAAEVSVDGSESATPLGGAQLTFHVSAADVTAAAQNLTAVEYDSVRDEWRVQTAAVNVSSDGKAIVPIARTGSFALVYGDKGPGLVVPPLPTAGDVLRGVPAAAPDAPTLVEHDFVLNPPVVVPSGRTVATLRIEGTGTAAYPSGTAVQAFIDEELQLADGSRLLDPPFATDLLLYRTLTGDLGVADFHLAPSTKAAQVVLEVGVDHIRVHPYPGRLDRGTLIGSEGGRVPADDKVAVDIPTGAVPEPVRATAASLSQSDLIAIGSIAGYRVVGGFQFTLQRANEPAPQDLNGDGVPDAVPPLELFVSARATFTVDRSNLPSPTAQVILGELLDQTPFGKMVRLAAPMMPVDSSQTDTTAVRFTTRPIDRSVLPVDGILHEGRYVVLAAEAPIAFATGTVHFGSATGRLASDARVLAAPLGVADLSRATGIYNIPVPARPAAPFTLVPRHLSTGDGAAYVNPAVAEPDAVVHVDLALVAQPPVLSSVVVLKGDPPSQTALGGAITTDVALTTNVRASFSPSIDPASVTTDSITVTDATSGEKVKGSAAADGSVAVVWTLNAGEKLKSDHSYIVAVSGLIRGSNGASLAHGASFSIATSTQVLNTEVHRERIRITLPDANGVSRISGDAGAIPAGWQALAVRRVHDFVIRYQATAASDGSFSFSVGNGGDAADRVGLGDLIDLQVINSAGNLAAIFSLTPFVTEDGKGFVVPAGAAVRYTTPEGITLDVPAGAFDVPTVITVAAAKKEDFLEIPSLESENEYIGSVRIDFDGEAKKPLVVETPVPAGFDTTGKQFILAQKGMSLRGARLAVIDLMRVDHGKFTNSPDPNAGQQIFHVQGLKPGTDQTLTGSKFSKYMRMLLHSGIFMYLDIRQPVGGSVGWAVMEGLQAGYDLTWDIFASYYIPHEAITERGGALLPIITGRPFTVVGTDPGTGLQAFSRTYDPIPVGEPGTVVPIDSAQQNAGGPYPVFGSPFRVEILDLDVEGVDINSVRNFSVRLEGGNVRVSPGSTPLDADRNVELLNVSNGTFTSGSATSLLSVSAKAGDRIVLLIEERDVDPSAPVSVVFNEPVYAGSSATPDAIDTYLHGLLKVEQAPEPVSGTPPSFADITAQVTFTTDSGGRRINVVLPSALQREAVYRVTLQPDIADVINNAPGLKLGQGTVDNGGVLTPVGGGNALSLVFHVRKPAGPLGVFTAAQSGLISGMDLAGNTLFIAAQDGGLLAYDVSNPAALGTSATPIASIPGRPDGIAGTLAITIDRHNRIYTTAQAPIAGMFRSYRVEDFLAGGTPPQKASALISWKLGYSQMIGLPSNTVVSDRPESIPFRIKVLLQDDEQNFANRQDFVAGTGAALAANYPDDLQKFTLTIGKDSTPYNLQRITVENLSLDMRWSADAGASPAVITNIIARSTDKLRLLRNQKTFAVVAHLGYGLGIYDANGIESNRSLGLTPTSPGHIREQLVLTAGKIDRDCPNATPDFGIVENYLNTDAELRGDVNGDIFAYAPDPYRGVLDLQLKLPSPTQDGTRDDSCEQRSTPNYGGLLFRSAPDGNATPRIAALRSAVMGMAGREPFNHFTQVAQYHWSVTAAQNSKGLRGTRPNSDAARDYLLVAGFEYGLIVVDINSEPVSVQPYPLVDANVADVIWIPGSAAGVRVYQNSNIAVVSDRYGRVLLVDLSRIDERWDDAGAPTTGLFPTVRKALAGTAADPFGLGSDDPRIIWKSEPGVVSGTLAPVFDPNTGIVFAGAMTQRQVKILSAIDPRLQVKVNLGSEGGLSDVGGIVPLGIAPPANLQSQIDALPPCDGTTLRCKENASLGAFRLEVALPGNMVDALTGSNNELQLAVESERVAGAITEQTPDGFPRAHLRRTRRDGSPESSNRIAGNFKFHRIVPDDLRNALKSQSGYNRFVSPWVIAIADPRASSKYDWNGATTQQKKDAGCDSCDRPKHLQGLGESDGVYELWTNGRFVAVRPELTPASRTIFDGTIYSYLGDLNRLAGRFSTIIADTVRPTEALVAGQNPPVAVGNLQQTTFLHSGEVETNNVDLDAGGRAAFNVRFDRTYRSRTIGGSFFGQGWDSSMFRRLRALPNGDVEFRDGADLWRFRGNPSGGYDSPKGLFLKLSRTDRGWKMIDQQWRVDEFDDLGRLLSESDEFLDLQAPGSGNVIRYVYDDSGRLSQIIDPVQRSSTLTYWKESDAGVTGAYPGLVKEIADWRDRKTDYLYDGAAGTLLKVQLPDVTNTSGGRPTVVYGYTPAGAGYNDSIELRSNLASITDPQEAGSGGTPRVQFTYGTGGVSRDHVLTQQWGTGESASFTYNSATAVDSTDTLGQARKYTLTVQPKDAFNDRAHVLSMIETSVSVSSAPFGQLPSSISASTPSTTGADRNWSFAYDAEGLLTTNTLAGVRSTTYTYNSVQPEAPGFVPASSTATDLSGAALPVTNAVTYQSGANRSTFVSSVSANGQSIDTPEPSRNYKDVVSANDNIAATDSFDRSGLLSKSQSSGGTDSSSAGADVTMTYGAANDGAKHKRAELTTLDAGGVKTDIAYPSPTQSVQTDARGIVTTTDSDSWDRPTHIVVTGPQMTMDERLEYDATGHLIKHVRKQGSTDVTRNYQYDVMGRPTSISDDNVAGPGTVTTAIAYDLRGRTIVTTHPGGSVTTTTLDTLGRVSSRQTTTGGSPVSDYLAYDLDGNIVFVTDLLTATAKAFDAQGRLVGILASDGTRQTATLDAWGRPTNVKTLNGAGAGAGESTMDYTAAGRLKSIDTKVDGTQSRVTNFAWDGGGRTTGMSESGRAGHAKYDSAGRLLSAEAGDGNAGAVSTVFDGADISGHTGTLPQTGKKKEKSGSAYDLALEYNAAADVTTQDLGSLEWKHDFDQAGNVTSAKSPNRPAYGYQYDSRGSVTEEALPGGAANQFAYHPTGALASYTDPANEVTQTTNDLIGRPVLRSFKDGTTEKIEWEGRRVKSITDRQNRLRSFEYNAKGQIAQITGTGGAVLDKIEYDDSGRIVRWTNDDAVIEYSDFDFDGHPRATTQSRYRGGALVDKYSQSHSWTVHGERSSWTMPTYAAFNSRNAWTSSVTIDRDAMGNVTKIQRTIGGGSGPSTLLDADYRNSLRPNQRKITTPAGQQIVRDYGYDSNNGLLNRLAVTSNGVIVAGSEITYDGLQKSRSRLLGVSGGARADAWNYDERSRLLSSTLARDFGSTPEAESLTAADFRNALRRSPPTPVDPPSILFTEDPAGGHKISVMQRGLVVENFLFNGGDRREDGRFTYDYDAKGRLSVVSEKLVAGSAATSLRRVRYFYDGNDRVVGRRAEYAVVALGVPPAPAAWILEDRPEVMAGDPLPPDATFVWDPLDDELVAIFKAGASENPAIDANGGLVRQIINGQLVYDDPLEVTEPDPISASGVHRLYPIFDEAGAGSLQVVLNEGGQIVSRAVAGGPFGEDQAVLVGPAVDKISVSANRDSGGNLVSIDVSIRATEQIAQTSVTSGFRLAAVDSNGKVVRTTAATASLLDDVTAHWTLTPAQWNALIDPSAGAPAALSIATTGSARGAAWGASLPFQPAPSWAVQSKPVYTSADLPVEVRESLAGISSWLASIPNGGTKTNTLYTVESLYALATPVFLIGTSGAGSIDPQLFIVSAAFHAQPFGDPFTGKNFVRARWFDPETGTFLTVDPQGYRDSANLYAYCGNDPVNCSDPSGEARWPTAAEVKAFAWSATKTVAVGVGVTIVATGAVALGIVSAPVVVTAGIVVAVGGAAYNGYKRYNAGQTDSVLKAGAMGLGDVTGVNAGIEAYSGSEVGTGRHLSGVERADRAGTAFGTAVTIVVGPKVVKGTAKIAPAARTAVLSRLAARPPTAAPAGAVGRVAAAAAPQTADFVATAEGMVRNVPAVKAPPVSAPEGLTVSRFSRNPLKTGIRALGQKGGSFATTVEEANQLGGLRLGKYRILFRTSEAIDRFGLPIKNRPFTGLPLFGEDIPVPTGQPIQPGIVEPFEGTSGGAPEFFFPWKR